MLSVRKRWRLGGDSSNAGEDTSSQQASLLEQGGHPKEASADGATSLADEKETSLSSSKQKIQKKIASACCCYSCRRSMSWTAALHRMMLLLTFIGGLVYFELDAAHNHRERIMTAPNDPFEKAKILEPHRYLCIKWLESPPSAEIKTFALRQNNSFVIHLEEDALPSDWSELPIHKKDQAIQDCPSVAKLVGQGKFGDAGCTLSHLRTVKKIANEENLDCAFVFEDDAKIHEPLMSQKFVQAPSDADVIFPPAPSHCATKAVPVKTTMQTERKHHQKQQREVSFVRIIEGCGAHGYVIAK